MIILEGFQEIFGETREIWLESEDGEVRKDAEMGDGGTYETELRFFYDDGSVVVIEPAPRTHSDDESAELMDVADAFRASYFTQKRSKTRKSSLGPQ